MPTYVYETISEGKSKPKRYEIRHGINEPALDRHPETGEKIRRVIAAGAGILTKGSAAPSAPPRGGHCCGGACGCR